MPEFSGYTAGVPCWVDLGTPDVDPSVSFYGELFGWEADDLGEEARGPGRAPRQPGGPVRRRRGPAGRAVLGDHVGDLDWIARPHGVTVSTRAFHARSAGSIPAGGTRRVATRCPADRPRWAAGAAPDGRPGTPSRAPRGWD